MTNPTPRVPTVTPDGAWTFTGLVTNVVDGDTCDVELYIDAGFDQTLILRRRIRILGIDAPETSTPEGKAARDYARATWTQAPVFVQVVKHDKFGGRDDGHVYTPGGARDWGKDMLAAGMAKPYDGGPR